MIDLDVPDPDAPDLDTVDRALVNCLQDGILIVERPFVEVAAALGLAEAEVTRRVRRLLETGVLSRFGPLYNAERLQGGLTLAAMRVPPADLAPVAAVVNGFPEVAHNYARAHAFNLWFVVATEEPGRVAAVLAEIAAATGLPVHDFPKLAEYTLNLRFAA